MYIFSGEDIDIEHNNAKKSDPEHFVFDCLTVEDVDKLLNESVEYLSNTLKCEPSFAKTLLLQNHWSTHDVITKYRENATDLLVIYSFQFYFIFSPFSIINLLRESQFVIFTHFYCGLL